MKKYFLIILIMIFLVSGCGTDSSSPKGKLDSDNLSEQQSENPKDDSNNETAISDDSSEHEITTKETLENLPCPFTEKEFENIYSSKLSSENYILNSTYNESFKFWELKVVGENAVIVLDTDTADSNTNIAYFYIKYGLDESVFDDIVSAFIETLYPDMNKDEFDSLKDKFINSYITQNKASCGIRGNGEINIVMQPSEISEDEIKISALKK